MANSKSYSVTELSSLVNASVIGDQNRMVYGIASLHDASEKDISYCISQSFLGALSKSGAGVIVISDAMKEQAPESSTLLVSKNPEVDFARIVNLFNDVPRPCSGIHPTAVIADSANIDPSVSIGPHVVIGERVLIGAGTFVAAGTVIGDDVQIGQNCILNGNVTIYHGVQIEDQVILHSGVVVGADGFGYANDAGKWLKIPQVSGVVIQSNVEVGANTCIDRGFLQNTVIENGVKIDNMVQIAHNVFIGAHTAIAGSVAIAGSTTIGKHCMIAGQAGIAGHLSICDGVVITGAAMIIRSISKPGVYSSGTGFMANQKWRKNAARFRKLDELFRRVKKVEGKLDGE